MDPNHLLAQKSTSIGRIGGTGLGPFGSIALDATTALAAITKVVSSIVGIITIAAGIWFLIHLLIGGLNWISAEGDSKKLQAAQHRITNGFLGLLIVIAGIIFISLASKFLGYDILITSPGDFIRNLKL